MSLGIAPLRVSKTTFYPYVFVIAFLGLLAIICLMQCFNEDPNLKYARYFFIVFTCAFFMFLFILIGGYTSLTIYQHRLVLKLIFTGTRDEILFEDVETATIKNLLYSGIDGNNMETSSRKASLNLLMKNGQELQVDLNSYPDLEEIITTIKTTDLWIDKAQV